jgi:hypothetical protein
MPIFTIACGICTYWIFKSIYPFLDSWILLFSIWYVLLSIVRTVTREPLRWIPKIWWAAALFGASVLLAPAFLGPLIGLWIPAGCLAGTVSALDRRRADTPARPRLRRLATVLSTLMIALLVATAAHSLWRQSRRTPVERCLALQYPTVFPEALHRLENESPAPCRDLQEVFRGLRYSSHATRTLTALERMCTAEDLTAFLGAVASGRVDTLRPETRQIAEAALDRRMRESPR